MSEAIDYSANEAAPKTDGSDGGDPDALALSALISSRVCHDLINPAGAIRSGLEVLDDPDLDGGMREAAFDLIRSGATKTVALLAYARLAYGAAGGLGAQISLDDAKTVMTDLVATTKAELDWRIASGLAAKENVKVLLTLVYAATDGIPRGGVVTVDGEIDNFKITATGKKVLLPEDLTRALAGETTDLTPKFTPAYIAAKLAASRGGEISAALTDDVLTFTARVPQ